MSIWSLLGHVLLISLPLILFVSCRRLISHSNSTRLVSEEQLAWPEKTNKSQKNLPAKKWGKKFHKNQAEEADNVAMLSELPWPEEANKSYKNQAVEADCVAMFSEMQWPEEANKSYKNQVEKADCVVMFSEMQWPEEASQAHKKQELPWPEEENQAHKKQAKKADHIVREVFGPDLFDMEDMEDYWIKVPTSSKKKIKVPEEAYQAHKKQAKKGGHIVRAGLFRPDLYGMDDYEIKVLDFLECGTAPLLGIHGMRGVGKTTLLKLVRTSYRQRSSFRYVFYAEAGNGFTVDMLRGVLARNVGLDPMAAVNRISSFLQDESFLLLLDNVSASFDLAAAGLPITLGPWQKVIFTTRNEAVCTEMGCAGNTIQMYCLVGDVAWNLFKHNVGNRIIDSDPEIKYLAKQMVAHCRGFPSALCTVGRSMSIRKDVKEWIFAHELLMKGSPPNGVQDTNNEDYPCLEFFEDAF